MYAHGSAKTRDACLKVRPLRCMQGRHCTSARLRCCSAAAARSASRAAAASAPRFARFCDALRKKSPGGGRASAAGASAVSAFFFFFLPPWASGTGLGRLDPAACGFAAAPDFPLPSCTLGACLPALAWGVCAAAPAAAPLVAPSCLATAALSFAAAAAPWPTPGLSARTGCPFPAVLGPGGLAAPAVSSGAGAAGALLHAFWGSGPLQRPSAPAHPVAGAAVAACTAADEGAPRTARGGLCASGLGRHRSMCASAWRLCLRLQTLHSCRCTCECRICSTACCCARARPPDCC